MRSILYLFVTAVVLIGTSMVFQGSITNNELLLIGIVVGVSVIGMVVGSIGYPKHRGRLALSICGFILLLFIPCFATLKVLTTIDFTKCVLTFSIASVIYVGTIIFSYRDIFIKTTL